MNRDGFNLRGTLEWKHFNGDGELIDSGKVQNRITNEFFQEVIDAFDSGTFDNSAAAMGIGTGTGQGAGDTGLSSIVSHVAVGSGYANSQPSAAQYQAVADFTAIRNTPTITEACISGDSSASDHMYCYNDALSVSIGGTSDTLQITWTVDATQG